MKSIISIAAGCLMCSVAFAQVDSAEKKMAPPEFGTDTLNEIRRSNVRDTLKQNIVEPQDKTSVQPQDNRSTKNPPPSTNAKDGIYMKGGNVTVTRNGISSVVSETMMLDNGVRLKPDGTLQQKDGSSYKLKEGERYDLSGNMIARPAEMNKTPQSPDYNRTPEKKSQTTPERSNVPDDKTSQPKPAGKDKNMYLVPDSSVKEFKKDANPK